LQRRIKTGMLATGGVNRTYRQARKKSFIDIANACFC
jgi:hypothetical protein